MNKLIGILVVIIVIILGVYLIKGKSSVEPVQNPVTGGGTSAPLESTNPNANLETPTTTQVVKSFTVSGSNYAMTPKTLSVNKGDKVRITFKNTVGSHDLVIDEFNVRTPRIISGQEALVEFTADKTGSFVYYCSVGNHRAMGMWGTLTVN
ncbi:cupredoxin domain-containing protein [Candidatus Parcubacteria bacterium]|nr:cupredoxin domain-containing protein [Candidatus Parcubacteria bacterium]